MTSDLIDVADAAVPFTYSALPSAVKVVLGYIGEWGETPHVWSTQEADSARRQVGAWAPIWCPPQGRMTADTGYLAADKAAAALPQYGYPLDGPVFFDVERSSWDADTDGAIGAIRAFKLRLRAHGYPLGIPYVTIDANTGWAAGWVPSRPTSLPPNLAGQQWSGNAYNGMCDLSVFHRSVFAALLDPEDNDMPLDKDDKAWVVAQLAIVRADIMADIGKLHSGGPGKTPEWPKNVASVYDQVAKLAKASSGASGGAVDPEVLAAALAARLGPALGESVATALAKRLAT